MSRKFAFALAAFFALAGAAHADKVVMQVQMSKTDFDAIRSRMIGQLDSDRLAEITPEDKAAVIGALDRIGQRLAKPAMDDQDSVDIFNDQELINQITAHAKAESRLYCERESPTGSHVIRVTCMSMAKWMERDADGQKAAHAIVDNHRNTASGWISDNMSQNSPPAGL
jgi:hypothetical protein